MEHSRGRHVYNVQSLCRTCGSKVTWNHSRSKATVFPCSNYKTKLMVYYGVNIDHDVEDKHSKYMCENCVHRMFSLKQHVDGSVLMSAFKCVSNSSRIWSSYDPTLSPQQCSLCKHADLKSRGTKCRQRNVDLQTDTPWLSCPPGVIPLVPSVNTSSGRLGLSGGGNGARHFDILAPPSNKPTISFGTSDSSFIASDNQMDSANQDTFSPNPRIPMTESITLLSILQKDITDPVTDIEEKLFTNIALRKLAKERGCIPCKALRQPIALRTVRKSNTDDNSQVLGRIRESVLPTSIIPDCQRKKTQCNPSTLTVPDSALSHRTNPPDGNRTLDKPQQSSMIPPEGASTQSIQEVETRVLPQAIADDTSTGCTLESTPLLDCVDVKLEPGVKVEVVPDSPQTKSNNVDVKPNGLSKVEAEDVPPCPLWMNCVDGDDDDNGNEDDDKDDEYRSPTSPITPDSKTQDTVVDIDQDDSDVDECDVLWREGGGHGDFCVEIDVDQSHQDACTGWQTTGGHGVKVTSDAPMEGVFSGQACESNEDSSVSKAEGQGMASPNKKRVTRRNPRSQRFVPTLYNVDELIRQHKNRNTVRKTMADVNLFQTFLSDREGYRDSRQAIEAIPPHQLCGLVSQFILSVRKVDGTEYEPVTLRSMISSIDRHLREKNYGTTLAMGEEFETVRQALKAKRKYLKSKGKGCKPHASSPITDGEIEILWENGQLGWGSPMSIINTLWLYFTVGFGVRGSQGHRCMCWGDVTLHLDSVRQEYLCFNARQGDGFHVRKIPVRLWSNRDNPDRCPVGVYKSYSRKRPEDYCNDKDPFYIATNTFFKGSASETWFKRQPIGINKLQNLMKKMALTLPSTATPTSRLTNHSVRKRVLQTLEDKNTPATDTIEISGYKIIRSLHSYSTKTRGKHKRVPTLWCPSHTISKQTKTEHTVT